MTDPATVPPMDDFHAALVARISAISQGALKLRCVRGSDGHIELPRGATLSLSFTLAELRALGVAVQLLDADGNAMSDDAYVALLMAQDAAAAGAPAPLLPPAAA